jgi:hypothetical protein
MQAEYREDHLRTAAATGGDQVAGEIDYNTGRLQQPRQHIPVRDDIPAAENFVANSEHRGPYNSRNRSGSYLSNTSPSNTGFSAAQGQQQTVFPTPSPRHSAMRDSLSGSPSGNYVSGGPSRTGYPAQNYSHSPRNNSGNIHPFSYQPPPQYNNDVGGMGEGRYYPPKEYFGSGSNTLLPTGREGLGMLGATGPNETRVWGATAGGQGYMNQYGGHGRDPSPRPGQNVETDLSPDEVSY